MADPNLLLDHPASPASKQHRPSSLDDTIEHCIGDFGWAQIFQATLVSFAWFFDAQQTFISVFTDSDPKWSCTVSSSSTCNSASDICQLPAGSWSWDLPATTSIISEWALQCSGSIITGLPASAFLFGCLVGGFALATLADSSLGRKNLLVFSSLLMSITGTVTAFSTGFWVYVGLRFVSGFARATIGTCALVLSTELVGRRCREKIGIVGFTFFTTGFLSLPIIAFLLKGSSWRLIYIWTSVPSLLYSISVFFLVRESPRWLFIRGRKDEFAETLRSISGPAIRPGLTQSFFGGCCADWEDKPPPQETDVFSALRVLAESGWGLKRLAAAMVVGFGIGMIYYGMPLGLGNLSFDLYLSVTLNALSEFPASVVTFLLIGKLGRRGFLSGLALLSGACSVGCVLVRWRGVQMVLELLSFFGACTAFEVVLIYTLELFPTCVRNSAVSMVRQALVFGGALSPVLVAVGRKKGLMLSYGVFGVTISVCGMFVAFLPETRGKVMCDTMEEEERINNAAPVYCV